MRTAIKKKRQPDPLKRLVARVPGHCKCAAVRATISTTNPSSYALFCVNCYELRGWIAPETFHFIAEVVRLVGRPTVPIAVRRGAMEEPTNK
jgi:hypothetical protein